MGVTRMKKEDKYSKVFLKYLFSYIFILLIPVMIMGFIVYNFFLNTFKNEVIANTLNNLNKSESIIDEQVKQIRNISSQILEGNNGLKPFSMLGSSPIKDIKVVNVLNSYTATNTFISEAVLYLRGDENLYTSSGSCTVPMFTDNIYKYKNWPEDNFYKDISTISEPAIRPAEFVNENERYITFIYPFAPSVGNPLASLLFIVKEKSFQQLLANNIKNYNGNSIIIDKNNKIITSIKSDDYLTSATFYKEINSANPGKAKIISLNNKKWFLCVINSKEITWKYVTIIPVDSVMKQVSNIKTIFMYGIIFILILGSIFIYCSMNLNYKPLKQLKIYTEKIFNHAGKNVDEFQMVRDAIDFLTLQNGELSCTLKNSCNAIKSNLIFSLLKGEINTTEEFNQKGKDVTVAFTKDIFWVLVIKIHCYNNSKPHENDIINLLENSLPGCYEGYARDLFEKNEYILILSSKEENDKVTLEKLQTFQKQCKDELKTIITIGVGNKYRELFRISQSYIEASTALKHRFIKGNDEIIFFSEIAVKNKKFEGYPHKEIEGLKDFIKKGEISKIETALEYIANFIKQNEIPLFMARGICSEIINVVTLSGKEMGNEFFMSSTDYPDIFLLETLETVEEFINLIKKICSDICSSIKVRHKKEDSNLNDQIIMYIKQNFDNCNFSIQDVATNFGMNFSYMSQYFKSHFNQTIIDYITELRIEKAKKLLAGSSISLKYVAEETGYYNVSSFIRRFKQVTGTTPGQYREECI